MSVVADADAAAVDAAVGDQRDCSSETEGAYYG